MSGEKNRDISLYPFPNAEPYSKIMFTQMQLGPNNIIFVIVCVFVYFLSFRFS